MATVIVNEVAGPMCWDCLYSSEYGMEGAETPEEIADRQNSLNALREWSKLGHVVLGHDAESQHFGKTCVCCGYDILAGDRWDGTLTVFERPATKLTRAEVRRRFASSNTYRLVERLVGGQEFMEDGITDIRTIERVTTTGVYVKGALWSVTRLNDPTAKWFDVGDRKLLIEYPASENAASMTLTYELDPQT